MVRVDRLLLTIAVVLVVAGCSAHNPVQTDAGTAGTAGSAFTSLDNSQAAESNRFLWGYWRVSIDDNNHVEAIPDRSAEMHLNAVRLLEVYPCKYCLNIENVRLVDQDTVEADFVLRHPYAGQLKYTAFDVRGILILDDEYIFPMSERSTAWGARMLRLENPDGFTSLFNPEEFPKTDPPALGYISGCLANGSGFRATLNPYVAYEQDQPRCMFEVGKTRSRTLRLRLPHYRPLYFGYAVDGCWQEVENVIDPLEDFPPDANCLEAYRVNVEIGDGLEISPDGKAEITAEVFDHQGFDTIESVTVESPGFFEGEMPLEFVEQTGDESWLYSGTIRNTWGYGGGEFPILVRVIDSESDQNLGQIDAWQATSVNLDFSNGWARTWGGEDADRCQVIAVDDSGNSYVAGIFEGQADFCPGDGVEYRESNGKLDVFLSRFDSNGNFCWVRVWGGSDGDRAQSISLDDSGNLYVTGYFEDSVDFDPGSGTDIHISEGKDDAFLSRFDSNGNFIWARTWGGEGNDSADGVSVDGSGCIYVCGSFFETVDFDPGPGEDYHVGEGSDFFLSKFNSNGDFIWARTWGGSAHGYGQADDVAGDDIGNAYVVGKFYLTVDFDPGPGEEIYQGDVFGDGFISKFSPDGEFVWVEVVDAVDPHNATLRDIVLDDAGNLYVVGNVTAGLLMKYDPDGNQIWKVMMDHSIWTQGLAISSAGELFLTGEFFSTKDLDPGPGEDIHDGGDFGNAFLLKFLPNGDYVWGRTWGGPDFDSGFGVGIDGLGNSYVAGTFGVIADFNPNPGIEYHVSEGNYEAFLIKLPPDGDW
jgi:hypothetical protein